MKKLLIAGAALALPCCAFSAQVIDFQDLPLSANSYHNDTAFISGGVSFNNQFTDYGGGFTAWEGFAYSNQTDRFTPGFGNQYSAFPGGGSDASGNVVAGGTFALGYADGYFNPVITLGPGESIPLSLRATNTTYDALSMLNGDAFAKKFGGASGNDPDYFLLTITGFSAAHQVTGIVYFYLADFRFGSDGRDYVVDNWRNVDLRPLGTGVSQIEFALSSSDNGLYGMNTPAYFAIDNLMVVPEPGAGWLVGLGLFGFGFCRRRNSA